MRKTYSGVYPNLDAVPVAGSGYKDTEWPATAAQYARWAIVQNESGPVPAAVVNEMAYLPLILSITRAKRIVDFGGATGFSYIAVKYGSVFPIERYVVVEHAKVCDEGRSLFKNDKAIDFVEAVPQEQFDLAVIGAALQYVDDYKKLLRELAETKPRWFLLTKLPAGNNRTFAAAQVNLPGKALASWLFNVEEIIAAMKDLGYQLIFSSAVEGQINQDHVEPQYRLARYCNLLFSANDPDVSPPARS